MNCVKESTDTAKSLLDVIKSLSIKREVVIEKLRFVEQLEENADSLKNKVFQELYEIRTL